MTNLLTVVDKVFSNILIFLLQKCKWLQKLFNIFLQKKSMYLPFFKIEILTSCQLTILLSFEQLGPDVISHLRSGINVIFNVSLCLADISSYEFYLSELKKTTLS